MRAGVQLFGGVAQVGNHAGTGACGQGQGEGGPTGKDAMGGKRQETVVSRLKGGNVMREEDACIRQACIQYATALKESPTSAT